MGAAAWPCPVSAQMVPTTVMRHLGAGILVEGIVHVGCQNQLGLDVPPVPKGAESQALKQKQKLVFTGNPQGQDHPEQGCEGYRGHPWENSSCQRNKSSILGSPGSGIQRCPWAASITLLLRLILVFCPSRGKEEEGCGEMAGPGRDPEDASSLRCHGNAAIYIVLFMMLKALPFSVPGRLGWLLPSSFKA